MKYAENILETIGNTPLVKMNRLTAGLPCLVLAKYETFNPGNSVKDRMALQMVKDAEAHAEEDKQRKEEAEVRNQADSLVYQTEKLIKDQGDKLDDEEKSNVEDLLAESKTALAGTDIDAIKDATEKLASASQAMGAKLYEQAAAAQNDAGGAPADEGSDDDVVDAEVIEEDEDGDES